MASSTTEICNSALIKVGANRITALDDTSKEAVACNEQYAKNRDEVLSAHPWNFAIARSDLAVDATAPIWEFARRYPLPTDCLRVIDVDTDLIWKVEGRYILTDDSSCRIKYIKKETDVTKYSASFCEALAFRLASDLAFLISQNASLQANLYQAYVKFLAPARSYNGQEGSLPEVEADGWLNSRF